MYNFTLCSPDGQTVGNGVAPVLPRYMHMVAGSIILSDDPDRDGDGVTFARVGSSVHVDDDRNALFVEVQ
jgi:hypothetical protein